MSGGRAEITTANGLIEGCETGRLWDNRCSEAARSWSSVRPLAHLIDSTDWQDAVKAINPPLPVHATVSAQQTATKQEPICGPDGPGVATPPQNPLNGSEALSSDAAGQVRADCSIAGCEKPAKARGLCSMHYWRWSKHGDPEWEPPTIASECAAEGCDKAPKAAGHCGTHYSRLRRTGSAADRAPVAIEEDNARFLSKIDKRGPRLCWPWTGTILNTGYGQFKAQGKGHLAHRYAYRLFVGAIPEGLTVDHVWARGCMRHNCVNPHHLEAVTQLENTRRALMTRRELRRSA